MATLLITSAIKIGIGLAINEFFGPDDIQQEGQRLTNLGFAPSTYARFVDISWGTDRHQGNMVEATDPPIEEVASSDSTRVGKGGGIGGGQEVNSTTYQNFHTGRWSFGISGAKSVLKLWFNKKLIYDATSTGNLARPGVDFTFYPGGPSQQKDPGEVARHGEAEAQGYRHLTTIVFNRIPLRDIGNSLQSVEAIIAYEDTPLNPFEFMAMPDNFFPPSGGIPEYLAIDSANDLLYSLGRGTSFWSASLSELEFRSGTSVDAGLADTIADRAGRMYSQTGNDNAGPVDQFDADTGEVLVSFGQSGLDLADDSNSIGNSGSWGNLRVTFAGFGIFDYLVHLNDFSQPNGSVYKMEQGVITQVQLLSSTTVPSLEASDGFFLGDHDRNRGFMLQRSGATNLELFKLSVNLEIGLLGASLSLAWSLVHTFTSSSEGTDFPDNNTRAGWAVDRSTGNLMLSNGANIVLYNPDTDTTIATRSDIGFQGRFNYYSGTIFAFIDDNTSILYVVDTRTLATISSTDLDTLPWPSGDGTVHDSAHVWDEERNAIIFSRTGGATDEEITRLFVNRLQAEGVAVPTLVNDLMTSYQGVEMGGLTTDDFNATALTGDVIPGFTINNQSTLRNAMDIIRRRYFVDFIESDWIIKAVKRGGAAVVTIAADEIGQLSTDTIRQPPVQREQIREENLPMRWSFRYRNTEIDYSPDIEHDKRQRKPDLLVQTRQEITEDLSIAEATQEIKRLASVWLWTVWNEAGTVFTRLPLKFIRLDPGDPIELVLFNPSETVRVRLGKVTWGVGWFLEIDGIEEDARDYTSTLLGGPATGFVPPIIPGGNNTGLVFIDAPLLNILDINLDTHSNAYLAFRAFSDNWPGATAYRTANNLDFEPVATGNQEAAVGKVVVPPSTWARSHDGTFRNVFQEIVEGGTMRITPFRRDDAWISVTELQVYNGANAVAVVTSGGVEIIQFQDATPDVASGGIDLTRLQRGRLGTEDITDLDTVALGDFCVFLELGPVTKQRLLLADLNVSQLYRGVTVGTFLEDADSFATIYTGRDVRPYSVVAIDSSPGSPDGLDITWTRRARGPVKTSLSVPPPLNETVLSYKARLKDDVGAVIQTKDIATEAVSFSQAEIDVATAPATVEITQISGTTFESPVTADSTVTVS